MTHALDVRWYGDEPRRYRDPVDVIETSDPASVSAALRRGDDALAEGYSIAGFITYEAGCSANGLVPLRQNAGEPLVALGVFAGPAPIEHETPGRAELGTLVAQISCDRCRADLASIARALFEGEVYQVNYTVPFAFRFEGDAFGLFEALRRRANVPYAAFVRYRERAIVSLSPELFFEIDGERIRAKPMKGTSVPEAPGALASEKNRAEHVMIVDLLRNDLGRVCSHVDVPALFTVESYPTFATMTSTIEGELGEGRSLADVFAGIFPCGSITGAPKRAAMRAIARLERAPRSITMGTIGYCDAPRRGQWSVSIRTAVIDETAQRGELRIGGGIVADSEPATEWAEILTKRRAFEPNERAGLIETMRVSQSGIVARQDAHLERLERSAFALGISFDADSVRDELARAAGRKRDRAAILRLVLDGDGTLRTGERALGELPASPRLCIAPQRLRSSDPALRHKTTLRRAYDAALTFAHERRCFEAALCGDDGALADGARTTLFVARGDTLLTPPLERGALAGIVRAELIASGRAIEANLYPDDLHAGEVFVGSSVRGLFAVAFVVAG